MAALRVGNAPCSWGTLEFDETRRGEQIEYSRMLGELAETGYTGTELGDWGFMPTDPSVLGNELRTRNLVMLGAFVQVALKDQSAHADGVARAVKTARLLADVATEPKPFLVLADDNATDPRRTQNAGRITPDVSLSSPQWKTFAAGAMLVADAVLHETGLKTVFHHHCGGYVETPDEIARFLELTDPQRIGLVFDTGHYAFGSGHCAVVEGLRRFADRVWYIHLKDCQPEIAQKSRSEGWDYFTSLRHGVFCELGAGCVDFPAVLKWLKDRRYDGYVLVEQDILPGMGTPKASALRNREYLRSIEANQRNQSTV
jgi:inosose dehydratase